MSRALAALSAAILLGGAGCRGDGARSEPQPPEEHACVATTCDAAGARCGAIPDGCGASLECGTCPDGQTCGGGGVANACGAPSTPDEPGGATRWVRDLGGSGDEYVAAVRVRHDGVIVALTAIAGAANAPGTGALGLVWLSPGGEVLRSRTYAGFSIWPGDSMALSPAGEVFLEISPECGGDAECADLGAGPVTESVLVKLTPDGDLVWSVPWMGYGTLAPDASGGVAAVSVPPGPAVVKFDADGRPEWSFGGRSDAAKMAVRLDPDGSAVVGQALRLVKLDPHGKPIWTSVLSQEAVDASFYGDVGAYAFLDVGVTADGTVLAAGTHVEPLTVGTERLPLPEDGRAGVFLAAFSGKDGTLRWVRSAGSAGSLTPPYLRAMTHLAVHGAGPIALLVAAQPCGLRLERWTADGTRGWSRAVPVSACGEDGLYPWSADVAPAGDVLVGGEFSVPVDFGRGIVEGEGGRDGFVLDLAP